MTNVDPDRIDLFRREVDWNIACGALAEVDLPVTSNDGGCPVVVAFDDERFSVLLGRLRAVGGFANVFVKDAKGAVRAASVMAELCAVAVPGDRLVGRTCREPAPPWGCFWTTWNAIPTVSPSLRRLGLRRARGTLGGSTSQPRGPDSVVSLAALRVQRRRRAQRGLQGNATPGGGVHWSTR